MQVILTEEEYNALEGRARIRFDACLKAFRLTLGLKLKGYIEPGYRPGDETISARRLVKAVDEAAEEAFRL